MIAAAFFFFFYMVVDSPVLPKKPLKGSRSSTLLRTPSSTTGLTTESVPLHNEEGVF